jgi:transcriptional regulator with XRE-family HTH domain
MRRGWSQDDVADGLSRSAIELGEPEPGVDRNTVSRWERGIRHPRPRYVRLLCHLFGLPTDRLGLMKESIETGDSSEALHLAAANPAVGAEPESVTAMLEGLHPFDGPGLDDLRAVLRDLQRQYDSASP